MKKLTSVFVIICIVMISAGTATAQKLKGFKADLGKKSVAGKEVRVPYTDVVTYFGYVKPGTAPDEVKDGKKMYYLYVWIPAVAPELGVRMISPVPKGTKMGKGDIVTQLYKDNQSDTKKYFDTWIALEKAKGITSLSDVASKGASAEWSRVKYNDDSSEMPKQPSGSSYNSLMRITSETSNPMKSLTVGLYRIAFTTYKRGEVEGSFMAQVGAPIKLPGVMISNKLEDIKK